MTGDCPTCGGSSEQLGPLGHLMWWRCRYCGEEFSTVIVGDEEEA